MLESWLAHSIEGVKYRAPAAPGRRLHFEPTPGPRLPGAAAAKSGGGTVISAGTGNCGEDSMSSANIDPAAILNRALEYAAQNLRVEKLLIQLGLDPANITYDAVFNRLVDIVLANINFANMLALVGATLYVVTLMVRTIVPLRVIGIISMVFFIAYGALAGAVARSCSICCRCRSISSACGRC